MNITPFRKSILREKLDACKLQATNYKLNAQGAFTIVELLVSIALFSVVVSIAAGGFVRALRTQRQVVALISANSNASLAIEQMAREIRTGFNFDCDPPNGEIKIIGNDHKACSRLSFTNAQGQYVAYAKEEDTLERGVNGSFEEVTAKSVSVQLIDFEIIERGDSPPRIVILLVVSAKGVENLGATRLQTTVSPRD